MDLWRKLSSRKFWMAVAAFVVAIFIYLKVDIDTQKTEALIMAGGAVVAYIVAEGYADGQHAKNDTAKEEELFEAETEDEEPVTEDDEKDEGI